MKKSMFPREFIIWKDSGKWVEKESDTELYNVLIINPYSDDYCKWIVMSLDDLYKHWLLNIKTKEDESK